jgi:hypothetical protein
MGDVRREPGTDHRFRITDYGLRTAQHMTLIGRGFREYLQPRCLLVSRTSHTFLHTVLSVPVAGLPMNTSKNVLIVFCIAYLAVSGCAPRKPYDTEKIDAMRLEAESLIKAQSLMGYGSWVQGLPSNQDSLYRAHATLFTLENVRLVAAAVAAESDSVQKLRLRYLHRYLATEYLAKQTAPVTDKAANYEASATITVDGKSIPYRQMGALMANEPSQSRRAALYMAADPVLDSLNVLLLQVQDTDRRSAHDLGYGSYAEMAEQVKGFPLAAVKANAERVLAETEVQYTALLREILGKELRLTPERFYRHDTAPLFRSRNFDRYFTEAALLPTLRSTYGNLGIAIDSVSALSIDTTRLATKNPRAVCFTIDVPSDIRLSIKPIGGLDDYKGLFHEMGHALHYAHTKEHAFEFKYLGEYTVTETYAFLSEYILENQAWLRMRSGMPTPVLKDYVRLSAFQRLYMIRRYAAKVLYELELRSDGPAPADSYARMMSQAIGTTILPSDGKRYLTDVDAMFYSATYFRAWFLEGQLEAALAGEFGVNWFENRAAGTFLKSLWARGDRVNGDELALLLGEPAITPDALLRQIALMVTLSTKPGT